MINAELKNKIVEHAECYSPNEICGLLLQVNGVTEYHPCRNMSPHAGQHFQINPVDYARVEERGEIVAVVHSHPNGPVEFSEADKVSCEATGLPWLLVVKVGGSTWLFQEMVPTGYKAKLLGRPWCHGVLDCYAIIRDYYDQELNIKLPDFERDDLWWEKGQDIYTENFVKAGFSPIELRDIRMGDVILMRVGAKVTNHGAIYVGENKILHHLYNRLSCYEVYGGYWQKNTTHILRYIG